LSPNPPLFNHDAKLEFFKTGAGQPEKSFVNAPLRDIKGRIDLSGCMSPSLLFFMERRMSSCKRRIRIIYMQFTKAGLYTLQLFSYDE
jgi:hypothetical protein